MSEKQEPIVPRLSQRIRGFIQAHDLLFTLLGGLIVLAGFFVKEGLQEEAKDELSSIKSALALYQFKEELNLIPQLLDIYGDKQAEVGKQTTKQRQDQESDELFILRLYRNQFEGLYISALHFQSSSEAGIDLIEAVPRADKSLMAKQKTIQSKLDDIVSQSALHMFALDREILDPSHPKSGYRPDDLWNLQRSYNEAIRENPTSINRIVEVAQEEGKREESLSHRLNMATYILFSIGWFLGLIAKILKLPALSLGED